MSRPVFRRPNREVLAFVWALAEATCWPIMPDAALVPLAASRPASWLRLALAATAGSCLGGVASYAVGRKRPARAILTRLPLVRPAMIEAADRWLADEGAMALRHQPLWGLPYKVFAWLAGGRGVPLPAFAVSTALFRGARFLAASAAAALLGRRFAGQIERHRVPLLVLWAAAFALALWQMVASWERRPLRPRYPPPSARSCSSAPITSSTFGAMSGSSVTQA